LFISSALNAQIVFSVCDTDNDGFAIFDLETLIPELQGSNGDLQVTFHGTQSDAENGVLPLASPYSNDDPYNDSVWARIESIATGTFEVEEVLLEVRDSPIAIQPQEPLVQCDDTLADGFTVFDLTVIEPEVLGALDPMEYSIYYYELESDAIAAGNAALTAPNFSTAINNPGAFQNSINPQAIYILVVGNASATSQTNPNGTAGCYDIVELDILVVQPPGAPVAGFIDPMLVYDLNGDGLAEFDLTLNDPFVLGTQNPSDFAPITYHESLADAQAGTPFITAPEAYVSSGGTLWVRLESLATGCYRITSFDLIVVIDNEPPIALCENITVQLDNNGTATITGQDIDGGSTDNYGIQNYTASQTVFTCDDLGPNNVTLTVEDYFGNTDTCIAVVTVLEALELEAPSDLSIAGDIGQCFASNVDLGQPATLAACTWNLTNDAPLEFPIGQTIVTWTLENGSGQTTTSQQLVEVYMSEVDNAQVCYVTSDWNNPSQNRVFSKYSASLNGQNVDYHEVFRESSTGEFETVGYIVPPAESFLDATVNNNIQSYRYKIRTMDICGEQGPLSDYHKTILLQSSIAADNSINLAWNPYLGVSFSTYYIYRSVNGAAFELLGSIAATNTSYNDISANVLENFYEYFVSIDATTCANDPFQNPSVRSNQEYVNPNLVIKDNNWLSSAITIYPNPASEYLNVSVTEDLELREISVYNTLGQRLMVSTQDQINVSNLPSGVYYLSIETDQGRVNKSLLRK